MQVQGLVGLNTAQKGTNPTLAQGSFGEALVSEVHGRFYNLARNGYIFHASNQAAVALSLLSATATGLILSNPVNSSVNLALLQVCVAIATAPAAASTLHLCFGPQSATNVVHTTPGVIIPGVVGTPVKGQAFVDTSATLPATPVIVRAIGGGCVGASTINTAFIKDDIDGGIILPPGTSINIASLTTAVSVVASFVWAEVPTSLN